MTALRGLARRRRPQRREEAGLTRRLVDPAPVGADDRPRRQRLPRPARATRRWSRARSRAASRVRRRGRCLAAGHRHPADPRRARARARRLHRLPGGAGVLDRLPREPLGRLRAGRRRHPGRLRRPRPRVDDRRLPARPRRRCRWSRTTTSPPSTRHWPRAPRRARWCWSRRSTRSSATRRRSPSWPRSARPGVRCSWPTRRTRSASPASVVAGSCTPPDSATVRTSSATADPEQVARRPGWRGAVVPGRARAPGQPRAPVHLRHRAGPGRGGRRAGRAARWSRTSRTASSGCNLVAAALARGLPGRRCPPARCSPCRCRARSRPWPRSRRPPANGVRIGCFRPPSTPDGISRLRLTAHAHLDDDAARHGRRGARGAAVSSHRGHRHGHRGRQDSRDGGDRREAALARPLGGGGEAGADRSAARRGRRPGRGTPPRRRCLRARGRAAPRPAGARSARPGGGRRTCPAWRSSTTSWPLPHATTTSPSSRDPAACWSTSVRHWNVLDLAERLQHTGHQVTFVVVARAGLGTLNHSTLTVHAIQARGLQVEGVVIGSWPEHPGLAAAAEPRRPAAPDRRAAPRAGPRGRQPPARRGLPPAGPEVVAGNLTRRNAVRCSAPPE